MAQQQNIIVKLSLKDADLVTRGLQNAGTEGERALKRIEAAARTPTPGLKALGAASDELKGRLGGLSDQAGVLGTALRTLGPTGLVAAAGLAAIVARAHQVTQHFDAIADSAQRAGISTELLQALRQEFIANAGSLSDLDTALEKLQQLLGEAATGSEEARAKLARAGITSTDTGEAFLQAAGHIAGLKTQTEQAAAVTDLYGDRARGMVPAIVASAGAQQTLNQGLKDGTIASDAAVQSYAQLADKQALLNEQSKALAAEGLVHIERGWTNVSNATQRAIGFAVKYLALHGDLIAAQNRALGLSGDPPSSGTATGTGSGLRSEAAIEGQAQAAERARQAKALAGEAEKLRKSLEGLATPAEKIAQINRELAETRKRLEALRGAGAGDVDAAIRQAQEIARRRIAALQPPAIRAGGGGGAGNKAASDAKWLADQQWAQFNAADKMLQAAQAEATQRTADQQWSMFEWRYDEAVAKIGDLNKMMAADRQSEQLVETNDATEESALKLGDAFQGFGQLATSAIVKGEELSTVLEGLATDIQRLLIRNTMNMLLDAGLDIAKAGLAGWLGGGSSLSLAGGTSSSGYTSSGFQTTTSGGVQLAHGGAFDYGGNVIPFARGGLVDRPTLFPFARGVGLMGEAGPEGILPLKRLPSGNLGVGASGGPQVNVVINNNNGSKVTTQERKDERGGLTIDVMIDAVESAMAQRMARPGTNLNRALGAAANPVKAR